MTHLLCPFARFLSICSTQSSSSSIACVFWWVLLTRGAKTLALRGHSHKSSHVLLPETCLLSSSSLAPSQTPKQTATLLATAESPEHPCLRPLFTPLQVNKQLYCLALATAFSLLLLKLYYRIAINPFLASTSKLYYLLMNQK